jgi:hypothetical protein
MPAPFQQPSPLPAPPAQPASPAPPAPPAPNVVYAGSLPGGTMTRQELADLRARR